MHTPENQPTDHTLAVQRLFVQHQRTVLHYVLTIEPHFGDAQDIVQETFLTVTRKASTYVLGTNFPAWACTVARYEALQFQRQRARTAARLDEDVLQMLHPEEETDTEGLERFADALKECMGRLPPKAGDLIRRRYHLGQMPEEIAPAVGWTPNSVRVALSRARKTLRDCVESRPATP